MSIWCIWPDISVTILLLYFKLEKVFRRDRRHAHGRFSCCRQRWLRINKCTKFRHKREKKEKKAQQKAHKNRNGRLWGVIKTPKVVKIAEDTTFCGRQRGLGRCLKFFRGGERSEEREITTASVREFWSFMLWEWTSVPGNQPVVCISIMLPCGSSSPLTLWA